MKGHIRKRGSRSWAIILDLGRDTDGKRRQKWHSVKGTKKDAERELARLLHELNVGTYVEPTKLTLGEFLKRWLESAKTNVSAKTYWRYRQIVENDLTPALGSVPLPKLRPLAVQEYYAKALESGRKDGKGGLSAQTVLHHHRVLRQALQQALRWQLIARNPIDAVEPPRARRKPITVPSDAEIAWLLEASEGTRLHVPIALAIRAGMRRGEILGLHWSDVDLSSRKLTVAWSLSETPDGVEFKEPKSNRGRRTIALPPFVCTILQKHSEQQKARKALLGDAYEQNDLVCCREDGSVWKPSAFTSAYRDLLRRRKMRSINFHALRHCHASQLLKAGISPKVISERLGHSKVGFTLDTYAHLLAGMDEEAAMRLDNFVREQQSRAVRPLQ